MLLFPSDGECPYCGCIAWIREGDVVLCAQCGEAAGFRNEVFEDFAGEVIDLEDIY